MLSFRSEADVDDWCERRMIARGATLDVESIWSLSQVWYAGRADAEWRGRTPERAQEVLSSVGLRGEFWSMSAKP